MVVSATIEAWAAVASSSTFTPDESVIEETALFAVAVADMSFSSTSSEPVRMASPVPSLLITTEWSLAVTLAVTSVVSIRD